MAFNGLQPHLLLLVAAKGHASAEGKHVMSDFAGQQLNFFLILVPVQRCMLGEHQ